MAGVPTRITVRPALYLGIDPGVSGGIAAIDEDGAVVFVMKMPEHDEDVWRAIRGAKIGRGKVYAMLERVMPYAQAGRTMGATSAFTFGEGIGRLRMALVASRITFECVVAVKWQNALNCRTGGDKNVTKNYAQRLFSHLKVTHATADALLLAMYCRAEFGSRLPI
jgi:hypothetical protein